MKCRHKNVTEWHQNADTDAAHAGALSVSWTSTGRAVTRMKYRTCSDCGAWLPLGPSNDSGDAVAVEMRAAEIAAFCCIRDSWLACKVSDCERDGFDLDGNDEPSCPAEEVGYLARCIATHTDDEGGAR